MDKYPCILFSLGALSKKVYEFRRYKLTNSTIRILLLILAIIVGLIIIFIFATGKYEKLEVVKSSYALGTIINLKVYGSKGETAIKKAIEKLNDIDDKMSAFKEDSEISRITSKAGVMSQAVSKDTFFVIKKAVEYSEILEGTFDPTIRPLVKLWNIGTEQETIPEKVQIDETLKLVNYNDVILDESKNSIMLKQKNQALDVGGIAKGFAADE